MLEASVMAQFDNPNVVKMEGVITKSRYPDIFIKLDDLLIFLKFNFM